MPDLSSAPLPPVRADDHVRGRAGARVAIFHADFSCPHCARAWLQLRDADVRLVFRHLALKARHPRAVATACAAEAAGRQGAFWAMADSLWSDQGSLEDPHLWRRCEALGLDVERFEADRRSDGVLARVRRDVHDALRAGATGTPTLFLDGASVPGPPYAGLELG